MKNPLSETGSARRPAKRLSGAGYTAVLALLAACVGHRGPPPSTDVDETGYRDHLRVLASDEFDGRRPGTPGEDKTVAYLVERFRQLGLKPGNGESFLQSVPLIEVSSVGEPMLALAAHGAVKSLQYGKDMVIRAPREAADTTLRGDLAFVGYGIVAPEYEWNDYAQVDVRGKIVVLLANDPGLGSHDPKVFRGNAVTAYGMPAYKLAEAARHGAAGALLIHDVGAGISWPALVNGWSVPQLYPAAADGAAGLRIEGWLSSDAARALFAQAGRDFGVSSAAAAQAGFKAVPFDVTVQATVHTSARRFNSSNVIALLPGARHNKEYVLFTAHWDHLGHAPADAGGAVYNGAADNASGVAGLLVLAQSFSRTQPPADRTLAFVALTATESGMLGSSYYVDNPVLPLRDTAAVLNLDGLRSGGPTRDVTILGPGNSELEEYVREAALLQGRETRPDPNPELGLFYRSDQLSFARGGVPSLDVQAGLDDAARGPGFGRAELDDYFAHRYRQSGDKYTADWDVRAAVSDLRLYYEVGSRVARSRRFPRWYPNSEFRVSHHPQGDVEP